MNDIQALNLLAKPGETFDARKILAKIDGTTFKSAFELLRRLQQKKLVRFTGKDCIWVRLPGIPLHTNPSPHADSHPRQRRTNGATRQGKLSMSKRSSMLESIESDIKASASSPQPIPPKEDIMKKTKPPLKPIANASAKRKSPRVGYRAFVVERLAKPSDKVSVARLTAEMARKFPGKKPEYLRGWIFGMASWLQRNKKPCATLVRDHKESKNGKPTTGKTAKAAPKKARAKASNDLGL
jgi:hypothetical protein